VRICFSALLVCGLLAPFAVAQSCPSNGYKPGDWSRLAAQPCRENLDQKPVAILSPNRKRLLLVKRDKVLEKAVRENSTEEWLNYRPGDEFIWSLDSSEVLVSYCLGAAGPCGVGSTVDDGSSPTVTDTVRKEFASGHAGDDCYTDANVGALTWEDSDKIVVVAEIPPAPSCEGHHEGYFEAMVVSLSKRKVVARYNMNETIHRWHGILGTELLNDIKLVREDTKG